MKKFNFFSGFVCPILLCSLMITGCGSKGTEAAPEAQAGETAEAAPQFSDSGDLAAEPKYAARKGIQTVLFMGLDKFEAPEDEFGYLNDQQCDFLMLFILDKDDQVIDVLHLNRDTMTEIRRLGVGGGDAGKFTGQLALAHTYGSGGSDSCLNATKAVSKFLKGVRIDHYIAMTMTGVSKINDMVGGVEVTIPVDMTAVDPSFEEGATVLLKGEQALKFVRARGSLEDSSNLSRMERQRLYLSAFYPKLLEKISGDDGFTSRSLMDLTSDFKSDMTVNAMSAMAEEIAGYHLNPFVTIQGEAVVGEEFMEFYADEDSLNSVLISLFTEHD